MRPKPLLLGLAALGLSVVITWVCVRLAPREPRIEFVGFDRKSKSKWSARFRIVNDTESIYSYTGHDQQTPQYSIRTLEGSGWSEASRHSLMYYPSEIPSGTSREFHVKVERSPFQVGVCFTKGPQSLSMRRRSVFRWIQAPFSFIRDKIYGTAVPVTWSDPAKLPLYDSAGRKVILKKR